MTTTGVLHLGPDDLKAVPYGRWTAFIGPAVCDRCGLRDSYVHWKMTMPGRTAVLCEPCSDSEALPGRRFRSEWEHDSFLAPWELSVE